MVDYLEELFNVENEREEIGESLKVEGPVKGIESEEEREALRGMKNNKAPGISKINIDMLNAGGEHCLMHMVNRHTESGMRGREHTKK